MMEKEEFEYQAERLEIFLEYLRDEVGKGKVEEFVKGGTIETINAKMKKVVMEAKSILEELGNIDVIFDGYNYQITKN